MILNHVLRTCLAIIFSISILGLGFGVDQSSFNWIFIFYSLAFLSYLVVYRDGDVHVIFWICLAVLLRFCLIFAFPKLSDDIYRFYWDGLLTVHGFNPYLYLPEDVLAFSQDGLSHHLFGLLNSQEYYTVYPPVSQAAYSLGAYLFPDSIYGASVIMKIVLWIGECSTIALLYKLTEHYKRPTAAVLIYAMNPLVIVETLGNLHFEGLMFFFFIAAIYVLVKFKVGRYLLLAGILYGCSIATKLHTLMLLPFIWLFIAREQRFRFLAYTVLATGILLSPLIWGIGLQAFGASLDLYFQKFEYNASIYYIMRWIGYNVYGYNTISILGPILSVISLIGIVGLWVHTLFKKYEIGERGFWDVLMVAFTLFLLFATTVHPWYLIIPIGLSVMGRLRFILFWSYLITMTYINYSYAIFYENLVVVTIEYIGLMAMIYFDFRCSKNFETNVGRGKIVK